MRNVVKRSGPKTEWCMHNSEPISNVFRSVISSEFSNGGVSVLEFGSGTGEHGVYLRQHLPEIATWQFTDLAPCLEGITLNIEESGLSFPAPLVRSLEDEPVAWASLGEFDVIYCANTLHIAPWTVCCAGIPNVLQALRQGGLFITYGPFNYGGKYTSESNERFDRWLKIHKSPESGIRNFEDVRDVLASCGLSPHSDHEMPENNHCLVFQKAKLSH